MIIELPPYIEQVIIQEAQSKGITVSELIIQKFANPYPKGDIRRLKGIIKTDKTLSIDEMNEVIATGAIYGE